MVLAPDRTEEAVALGTECVDPIRGVAPPRNNRQFTQIPPPADPNWLIDNCSVPVKVPKHRLQTPGHMTQHERFGQGRDRLPNPHPHPHPTTNPRLDAKKKKHAHIIRSVSPSVTKAFGVIFFLFWQFSPQISFTKAMKIFIFHFEFFCFSFFGLKSEVDQRQTVGRRSRNAQNQIEIEKLCTFLRPFLEMALWVLAGFGLFWFRFRCRCLDGSNYSFTS